MTEEEWRESNSPSEMLDFVRLRASDRQLRLFACACCRLVWDYLLGEAWRRAVELGERYADGLLGAEALEGHQFEVFLALRPWHGARARLGEAASEVLRPHLQPARVARLARTGKGARLLPAGQCDILRDIILPFRRVTIPAHVLAWNDGTVRRIAEGIYEERAFERLPILADALLDAGCDNEELLAHCRSEGPHVRGCWALDAILDRW
jgi:hypothetical protein